MLPAMDEDQRMSSAFPDSSSVSLSTQRKRKKSSKSSSGDSEDTSLASAGDRSSIGEDEGNMWADIFGEYKVMVCMQPRNLSGSKTLITHAEQGFLTEFEYTNSSLPFPFVNLFGRSTIRHTSCDIEKAILAGKNTSQFNILYTANGSKRPSHVEVVSINGNRDQEVPAGTIKVIKERYAILTIRPSSKIGIANLYGIGFFGPNKASDAFSSNDEESVSKGRKRARKSEDKR